MPLTNEERSSYETVRRLQEAQRQESQEQISYHQSRVRDLNTSISLISKALDSDATPPRLLQSTRSQTDKYSNMSVRWAILDLLSTSPPMSTPEIAEALKSGGIETTAANFANNVSAVLSTSMKERHNEVQQLPDGKWELMESGRRAIEHIRTTPKFRSATRSRHVFARS